jgi:Domain of unknown function (DUF4328)
VSFIGQTVRGGYGPPRDPRAIWLCLKTSVIAAAILVTLQIAVDLYDLFMAPDARETLDVATYVWIWANSLLSYGFWVVYLATLVFLIWLTYRLMRNLHTLAPQRTLISPTYAMSSYVAPFIGLFLIPSVAGLIWRTTMALTDAEKAKTDPVAWWWGTVLAASLLWICAHLTAQYAGVYDEAMRFDAAIYEQSLYFSVATAVATLLACRFLLRVFGPITQAQSQLLRASAVVRMRPD